jgi:predicted amidohydrolase
MKTLTAATCQFSVEPDIEKNCRHVLRLIDQAAEKKADVVHFSECALSGYAGVDLPDLESLDWDLLTEKTRTIQNAAREHRLWVLLGSTHRLSGRNKPHNSVYVIDPRGRIVERYDKRFCTGRDGKHPTFDLGHYSPGNRACVFKIRGVTCAVLICYDYRFPELYRDLRRRGVEAVFQSFHNARRTVVENDQYNIWKTIVPATMACRAAENHFWISANNSATRPSCWGSFAVRPDGAVLGRLPLHRAGALVTEMHIGKGYFDAPALWRESAMAGQLHSGRTVHDPRSSDVTCL